VCFSNEYYEPVELLHFSFSLLREVYESKNRERVRTEIKVKDL